ncbi:hypothetical protein PGIGA_G00248160 [Pangasianodon gigas]|uniref:Uncharacterized protein n=1 Tax=Pangasianodon gigas TaxID=30993 RepID=A0ACC5WQ03_PANGG|nr:hypothetical protein [Pangasianodon gigas]
MLPFLKLTLLTLLITAPGLLVSGENVITCDGDVHRLTCDTGLIMVKSTLYGRTDSTICKTPHPPNLQITGTSCSSSISAIGERCNGLTECEVNTDVLDTPDPCKGTYKYYQTTYECISGRVVAVCENGYRTLDCGDDSIQIINANYGRADSVTCSHEVPTGLTLKNNCYAPNTLSLPHVAQLCDGHQSCTVEASSTIFTDPCQKTVKYLTVSYTCNPSPRDAVTCEGSTAKLTCGTGKIKINSAKYGRSDTTTCSSGQSENKLSNTHCDMSCALNIVAARCDGQSSCEVPATNDFFSDPCSETYKYLKIGYSCV